MAEDRQVRRHVVGSIRVARTQNERSSRKHLSAMTEGAVQLSYLMTSLIHATEANMGTSYLLILPFELVIVV